MCENKALAEDSCKPSASCKPIRLYSMRFCPYSHRVRLFLNQAGIEHEVININLNSKPCWFLKMHPQGSVPLVEIDGRLISDSVIILELLNEMFAESLFTPNEPMDKAETKLFIQNFQKVINIVKGLVAASDKEQDDMIDDLQPLFLDLDYAVNGKFFGGTCPSLVDIALWPWFERLPAIKMIIEKDILPCGKFPNLEDWMKAMKNLDSVRKSSMTSCIYADYMLMSWDKPKSKTLADIGVNCKQCPSK